MQGRKSERKIQHEAISHGIAKSSHAMRNSKGQQLQGKFRALCRVHCIDTIYHFEAQEVRSPMLQTVCKSELKWRRYSHLKATAPSWKWISHHLSLMRKFSHQQFQMQNFSHQQFQMRKFRTSNSKCENFRISNSKCEYFRTSNSKCENFAATIPNAKFSHQPNPYAKFSQLHIWLAKSSCNLQIFAHRLS